MSNLNTGLLLKEIKSVVKWLTYKSSSTYFSADREIKPFRHLLFIHPFNKYLLDAYYVSGTVLSPVYNNTHP